MISLFTTFAFEDGKQLLSRLYKAIFLFCVEKCHEDAEGAEVGKLCGSAPQHPVRSPVLVVTSLDQPPRLDILGGGFQGLQV